MENTILDVAIATSKAGIASLKKASLILNLKGRTVFNSIPTDWVNLQPNYY
ncbi:hypothetical protein [Nostoc sp. JL33]|uniref:hypothetical protein n=1 Tax=Nostoc sp. JL33 TaxID=2815396 RepID=UPI0025ED5BE6|nr:hypothetical protein [Nostoc sp. JL33]